MSDPVVQVMTLVGCSEEEARKAQDELQDIVAAVDRLLTVPPTRGNTQIPPKPVIDRGMSEEQAARCDRARKVCDTINAAQKSAYHSAKKQADSVASESSKGPAAPAPGEPGHSAPSSTD